MAIDNIKGKKCAIFNKNNILLYCAIYYKYHYTYKNIRSKIYKIRLTDN